MQPPRTLDVGCGINKYPGAIGIDRNPASRADVLCDLDLTAQLAHGVDVRDAVAMLKDRIAKIPNVLAQPAPDVEILQFTLAGPVLAVRPYCNNTNYWQVYFDTNRVIRDAFASARYPVPEQHMRVQSSS